MANNTNYVLEYKSKWTSDKGFKPTINNILNPLLNYCNKLKHNHGKTVNIYMFYEIRKNYNIFTVLEMVLDLTEKESFHLVMDITESYW